MSTNSLWVEMFRPTTLENYIGNEHLKEKVQRYIDTQDVPHLLFYGRAGTGKTTLAKIIANSVDADIMYINASDENNVETVRTKVKGFASTIGFKKWKIIILDESDYITSNGQAALRNLMETFSKNTRFVLTCNYVEKIIDPIQSRCQTFEIHPPSKIDVAKRIVQIMKELDVEFTNQDLAHIINLTYPDIRRVLNSCQRSVIDGVLQVTSTDVVRSSYIDDIIEELKAKGNAKDKFQNIRKIIADSKVRDFTSLYKELYDKVEDYSKDIPASILTIAEHQINDVHIVDKEINVAAMLLKIIEQK